MADLIQKTDTLNQGREKLNTAITDANRAKWDARTAKTKAEQALLKSESTQTQLNEIVIEGDSSVEAAQARVDEEGKNHATLKERVDDGFMKITSQLADKATKTELISGLSEHAYYQGVITEKFRDDVSGTDYYLTTIPHLDTEGNVIKLKRGFANDSPNSGSGEIARDFAERHNGTVVINSSIFDVNTMKLKGTQIFAGSVLNEESVTGRYTLGIKEDNTLGWFPPGTPATTILAEGYNDALTSFLPLIENGKQVDQSIIDEYTASNTPHPRQVLAQYENKDFVILTCDGRLNNNNGMTIPDVIRVLVEKGVDFAFNLDGGGSTQTVVRGSLINQPSDNNGYSEREVPDFLYFGKEQIANRDKELIQTNATVGEIAREVAKILIDVSKKQDKDNGGFLQLLGADGYKTQGIESWEGAIRKTKLNLREDQLMYWDYIANNSMFTVSGDGNLSTRKGTFGNFFNTSNLPSDFNSITSNGIYWFSPGKAGAPEATASYGVIFIQSAPNSEAIQVAFPYSANTALKAKRRRCNPAINWFEAWTDL